MELRFNGLWMKSILSVVLTLPLFAQGPTLGPTVFIDNPVANGSMSGVYTVSGWALDNFVNNGSGGIGTSMAWVSIIVDGVTMGSANLGISRPDLCQVKQPAPNCPNVGWAYSLNTALLSQGT